MALYVFFFTDLRRFFLDFVDLESRFSDGLNKILRAVLFSLKKGGFVALSPFLKRAI